MTWSNTALTAIDALAIAFGLALAIPALLVLLAPVIVAV
jgi:hypothetical protein